MASFSLCWRQFPPDTAENPQEAIPYLMEGIKKALTEQDRLDVNYQLHFYALFLLAQFGYQEAFPTVMELISIPANTLDTLLGGSITEGLDACLYSMYNGDIDLLVSYIIETQSNSYAKMLHKMISSAQQPVKTEKIYPNDPCPCGSGKKYKKCCMNKAVDKKEELNMAADRKKWLESYPEDPNCRIEGHIYLSDFYDREAIETDKLVYLALKHRAEFITMRETQEQKIKRRTYYLRKAFSKYAERCKAEGIRTFREYDDKYSIHHTSSEWLNYLIQLLEEQKLSAELKEVKNFCAGR